MGGGSVADQYLDDALDDLPLISDAFLAALRVLFPLELPSPTSTEREDLFQSGQQSVIRKLEEAQTDQIERASESLQKHP